MHASMSCNTLSTAMFRPQDMCSVQALQCAQICARLSVNTSVHAKWYNHLQYLFVASLCFARTCSSRRLSNPLEIVTAGHGTNCRGLGHRPAHSPACKSSTPHTTGCFATCCVLDPHLPVNWRDKATRRTALVDHSGDRYTVDLASSGGDRFGSVDAHHLHA